MNKDGYLEINHFLVDVFNDILRIEEKCLSTDELKNLSIKEIHIIEAVCNADKLQKNNRASDIAEALGVTCGTLTVAINTLEKKGYIKRQKNHGDKRIVKLIPTEKSLHANKIHGIFHHEMVLSLIKALDKDELKGLIKALSAIHSYFNDKSFSDEFSEKINNQT